jgi:hypothetical protein
MEPCTIKAPFSFNFYFLQKKIVSVLVVEVEFCTHGYDGVAIFFFIVFFWGTHGYDGGGAAHSIRYHFRY